MAQYKLAIIGGGPGGYNAAVKAAELGASVALIEKDKLGGTCLHNGCIPTKTLNKSAQTKEPFNKAMQRKNKVVNDLENQVKNLINSQGIKFYSGNASLKSSTEVVINQEMVCAEKIIIGTGSTPIMPSKLDVDRSKVMTSDEIVNLKKLPNSILIIGGGYVGCEYANIFSSYGASVTLVELLPRILAGEDDDAVRRVLKSFKQRKLNVYSSTKVDSIKLVGKKVKSSLPNSQSLETDIVLVAAGRSPNSKGFGLESLGIKLSDKGAVKVNESMQTNIPGVYAIGDVIDKEFRLAHVAEKEGIVAAENALGIKNRMSYEIIPTAVFTNPEIASVGKKEAQLKDVEYVVGKFWYRANAMAHCIGNVEGFAKIIINKSNHKILGATIVGDQASDLIQEVVIAMNSRTKVETLAESFYFHPSKSEVIKKAAEDALKKIKG